MDTKKNKKGDFSGRDGADESNEALISRKNENESDNFGGLDPGFNKSKSSK
jgi:hypothetical protein